MDSRGSIHCKHCNYWDICCHFLCKVIFFEKSVWKIWNWWQLYPIGKTWNCQIVWCDKMIKEYFENYFEKIKDTKKVARDKNIGVWWMPVFDSFLITIYFSWQLSVGVWIALDAWQSWSGLCPVVHGFVVGNLFVFFNHIHEHHHIYHTGQDNFVFHLRSFVCKQAGTARDYKTWHVSLEKDRTRYCSYQFHMETAKKVHESLKEGAKNYDFCICWNDRDVLWMDDTYMSYFV